MPAYIYRVRRTNKEPTTFRRFGIKSKPKAAAAPAPAPAATDDAYDSMPYAELQQEAKAAGLSGAGSRLDLIARLRGEAD
jgi:hypothetical protein